MSSPNKSLESRCSLLARQGAHALFAMVAIAVLLIDQERPVWDIGPATLLAASSAGADADGDGLTDAQEDVLQTSPFMADSDGDGFTDLEELACETNPTDASSFATSTDVSVGATARGEDGVIHVLFAIYSPSGITPNTALLFVQNQGGTSYYVPSGYIIERYGIEETVTPNGVVSIIDMPLSENQVPASTQQGWALAAGPSPGVYTGVDQVQLTISPEGIPLLAVEENPWVPSPASNVFYRPIPANGPGDIPASWTAGQECLTVREIVGYQGSLLVSEGVSSECTPNWRSCSPAVCNNAVGLISYSQDEVAMIGG